MLTFREGLLSPLAHDLDIRVTRFWVDIDEHACVAEFDATSLVVETAVKDGSPHGALSADNKATIGEQIQKNVLHSARFPAIRFESTAIRPDAFDGHLTLHGVTKPAVIALDEQGGFRRGTATLHQPDFGITPYKAAMGTLKVKADVRVEIQIPT